MTHEEAALVLDPETICGALRKYEYPDERLEAVNKACRIAARVLRGEKRNEN